MKPRYTNLWRIVILALYLLLTCTQLGLPGLHYDEAKEAGVNAVELLTDASVTAFRGATLSLLGKQLPLMVQDYIGALNVYLALPFLKLTGIGVPNLRALSVLTGLVTLLLLEKVVREMGKWGEGKRVRQGDREKGMDHFSRNVQSGTRYLHSSAPLLAVTLLAVSPSFVFWSRQGIFVTNLTQPLTLWALWQGLRWVRLGRSTALMRAAFASGLALYTKLLAIWILMPFWGLLIGYWLGREIGWWGDGEKGRQFRFTQHVLTALVCFAIAVSPLILFNWQTGGTFSSVGGNLTQSYYGVNNFDIGHNFGVRINQLDQVFRGDQFDYLGGSFSNWLAPWLVLAILGLATLCNWRLMISPLLLLLGAFVASLFTVSGLFVTHYALLQPILLGITAIAWSEIWNKENETRSLRGMAQAGFNILIILWFCFDLTNSIRYHQTLSQSGGLGDHSDASYHLAYYLRYNGMGAPVALDWGMDATMRYLSENRVQPIEIFGYESIAEPDRTFAQRLEPFLQNPDNVYLLRAPNRTVFARRREAFLQQVEQSGRVASQETTFAQRDGEIIFELWRVKPKSP